MIKCICENECASASVRGKRDVKKEKGGIESRPSQLNSFQLARYLIFLKLVNWRLGGALACLHTHKNCLGKFRIRALHFKRRTTIDVRRGSVDSNTV